MNIDRENQVTTNIWIIIRLYLLVNIFHKFDDVFISEETYLVVFHLKQEIPVLYVILVNGVLTTYVSVSVLYILKTSVSKCTKSI
jgi:hypothetical protein